MSSERTSKVLRVMRVPPLLLPAAVMYCVHLVVWVMSMVVPFTPPKGAMTATSPFTEPSIVLLCISIVLLVAGVAVSAWRGSSSIRWAVILPLGLLGGAVIGWLAYYVFYVLILLGLYQWPATAWYLISSTNNR